MGHLVCMQKVLPFFYGSIMGSFKRTSGDVDIWFGTYILLFVSPSIVHTTAVKPSTRSDQGVCPRCAICFRTMATPRFDAYLNSTLDRTALDWFYDKKTIKTSKAMEIILCLF